MVFFVISQLFEAVDYSNYVVCFLLGDSPASDLESPKRKQTTF